VEVVEHDDETSRRTRQIRKQKARQPHTLGAIVQAFAQLGQRAWLVEASVERVSQSGEEAP
jgi:monoamine oxidase